MQSFQGEKMNSVLSTERIPIKLWLGDLEDSALAQAKNLANLPFTYKHIAILSDAHAGQGSPIGAVVASENAVVINIVGVDISCGVGHLETDLKVSDLSKEDLKKVMQEVRKVVPVGLNGKRAEDDFKICMPLVEQYCPVVKAHWKNAILSLGSLGSGNHFQEFQKNSAGNLCLMVHCGSRNLGHVVATHYNKTAKALNEKYYSSVPPSWQLAFLPRETKEAESYLNEMNYCMAYAKANRELILNAMLCALRQVFGHVEVTANYDVHHNFARMEHHYGKNVLVHRKGATSAREGEIGLIPGSQGTRSYIVKGKGNCESYCSSSHGAGRSMSRTAAKEKLNLAEEIKILDDQGIIHGIRSIQDLDEATSSYKNIEIVMENQKDLVEIIDILTPIAVIKG